MIKVRKTSIKKGSRDLKKSKTSRKKTKRIELNSKELRINLEKLKHDVKDAYETMTKILPESIKDAEIKRFGNASHIILPKEYAGKRATVIVKK
jgi:putative transposon-encoded protein